MAKELAYNGSGASAVPAAQYIRMSTEHQRYSPDSQRAAIAAFAAYRGFQIVQTYQDAGKSGLTFDGRPALKALLADVLGGQQKFRAILVLDVSRWGRFQDTDQAAHYEFMCREVICPLLSGPKLMIFWTTKEIRNAEQEASPGRDYRQAA